jgi:hypothetical protein
VVGGQTLATNHLGAAAFKRRGGERSRKRRHKRQSGRCREDERKRTVRLGIETHLDAVKTAGLSILRDELGGDLHTDQVAAGV